MSAFTIGEDVAVAAVSTVASVLLLNVVGIVAARRPWRGSVAASGIVTRQVMRSLAGVATAIFVPCLSISSLGSQLSVEVVREVWPLLVWSFVNVVLSGVLSWVVIMLTRIPHRYRVEFMLGSTFSNVVAVPLVMVDIICQQPQLGGVDDCFEVASAFIFVYLFGWSILFWSVGVYAIRGFTYLNDGSPPNSRAHLSFRQEASVAAKSILNLPMVGQIVGLTIGLIRPLQELIFADQAPLSFVASALKTFGGSAVGILTIIMAGSLGKSIRNVIPPVLAVCWKRRCAPLCGTCKSKGGEPDAGHDQVGQRPSVPLGQGELELVVGLGDKNHLTPDRGLAWNPAARPLRGSIDVDMALGGCTTGGSGTESDALGAHEAKPVVEAAVPVVVAKEDIASWPLRIIAIFVVARMIVIPAALFTIAVYAALPLFSGPNADLARVVLLLQCFTPTANLVVVILQRENRAVGAEGIARAVLFQYLIGTLTLTVFTAAALGLVFGA